MKEFKLIVAGGRDFSDYVRMESVLVDLSNNILKDDAISIVSGMARGADALGAHFARQNNVMLYEMPADWTTGRGAGYARNVEMAQFADGLVAFWDGKSRGTKHMIETMIKLKKPYWVIRY